MLIAAAPSQIGMKIRAAMAMFFVKRPARRQMTSRRKPPSTTMIVCISFLLPCLVGFALRLLRLLVIADDAFQGTDAERRTFLAGGYDGDRAQGHVAPPLMFHAVSRGLASFAPGHSSGWLRAYGGGYSSFTPKRSAACHTQRGSSRNARATATMSALPEAMISSACSGTAIMPTARTLMLTDFFTCAA